MNSLLDLDEKVYTVLLVDDSAENLKLLTALLKDEYKLKVAKDGQKAIDIVGEDPNIDLILMDVMMPVMDGFEASAIIRKNPDTKHIPIIFLTGLCDVENERKGFESGATDFITKPVQPDIVKARISTLLALKEEKRKTEALLNVLLPKRVIEQLVETGKYEPEQHKNTSILFCDLVDFTRISAEMSPNELVQELSDIFSEFDAITAAYGGTRIKTMGDGYMAVTGLENKTDKHAENLVDIGLNFIKYLNDRAMSSGINWKCRIGINSGEITSGIIGQSRFQFDVVGDNVNIASRIESISKEMTVTVSEKTKDLLPEDKYRIEGIGDVELKGKGAMSLFKVGLK